MNALLVFLGAGFGGVFRYWISNSIYWLLGRDFPYGTLVVNLSGSFFAGILFEILLGRFEGQANTFRSLLLIGFLGGYTTFSSFSVDTVYLIEHGRWIAASVNIGISLVLCCLLTWCGVMIGKHV